MKVGTWVIVQTIYGKVNGVIEAIDENSPHNAWRNHPEKYPVIVKLQKPYSIWGKKITHMSFDWQGFPTKWERFARVNRLERY